MIEIEKPTIECVYSETDKNYGKFIVEPLERGYGTTLGNSLRRILLSSLPGAAVTSIKIDGILHEFSTVPGVKEDVTEIILNLKKLSVRLNGDTPKRAIINAVGPKEVTAADIISDGDVEIFNPELHIATLDERCPGDGDQSGYRTRIPACRYEQDGQHSDRGHSGGQYLYACQKGEFYGAEHACGSDHGL